MKTTLLNALAWLTGASKTLISFLLPILATGTGQLLTAILPVAEEVVLGLVDSGKSGDAKRSAAVDQIKVIAISQGIATSASVINMAVELAVAKLQEKQS